MSEAQAFAKVYTDPANIDLRRAEREANGFVHYDVEQEVSPISDPAIAKSDAMSKLNAKAAELRKSNPALTEAASFAKAFALNPDLAKAERRASRALLGI